MVGVATSSATPRPKEDGGGDTLLTLEVCIIEFCAIADAGVVWNVDRAPWPVVDISALLHAHWASFYDTAMLGCDPLRRKLAPAELPSMN